MKYPLCKWHSMIFLALAGAAPCVSATAPTLETLANLPLAFEANQGQAGSRVAFLARGIGYSVFLTRQQALLALSDSKGRRSALRMGLAAANPNPVISGLNKLAGETNYFVGNDPTKWHTGVPSFGRVKYEAVYPGIDLVYYGRRGQLEFDFLVRSGSDPSRIRLRFAGARRIRIAADGSLVVAAGAEEIRFQKPAVYQTSSDGTRIEVAGRFVLRGAEAGFQLAAYDHSRPLVIDPAIVQSTFLGGKGADIGHSIAVDAPGFVYVTGSTTSLNFPVSGCVQCALSGPMDAFVTKFNPGLTGYVYSTYLGGSGSDAGQGIAVDTHGNAYVTGWTNSINFPVVGCIQCAFNGGTQDSFVTALNASGLPIYSTYLGGNGTDTGYGIASDAGGNVVVTGGTTSPNFPVLACFQCAHRGGSDAFVTGFNPVGALQFSTYLGGRGNDTGYGIALDTNNHGEIGVTGSTASPNFPVSNCPQCALGGGTDAFASELDFTPPGPVKLKWSTYWGGSTNEAGYGIAFDDPSNLSIGELWITGYTTSTSFPVTPNCVQCVSGGGSDAIVVRFNFKTVAFSDYLGGSANDAGRAIVRPLPVAGTPAVVYITGDTFSRNFPVNNPLPVVGAANNGGDDAFVAEYTIVGPPFRLFSSYLGGKLNDVGRGIAIAPTGDTTPVMVTGSTLSGNYPIVAPCTQCAYNGGGDAFVTAIH